MSYNPEYSEAAPTPDEVSTMTGDVLLEFGAPWCQFCQGASPFVEEAVNAFRDIPHIKVYDGRGKKLGRSFGVKLWPTLVTLKNGQEVGREVRPNSREAVSSLLSKLDDDTTI